ncbi:MAG: hypothetical protein HRU33_12365 [Rhodobacteraceae bacterium]|nr:hypothetical protein [Paracoccaceae bacterium]
MTIYHQWSLVLCHGSKQSNPWASAKNYRTSERLLSQSNLVAGEPSQIIVSSQAIQMNGGIEQAE